MNTFRIVAKLVFLSVVLSLSPVSAADAPSPSESHTEVLQELIDDIENAVEDADRRMVAHPSFIDKLRALVERYRSRLRTVFFFDDFSDGDYTDAPLWKVSNGDFTVTADQRLRSRVEMRTTTPSQAEKNERDIGRQVVETFLKDFLGSRDNGADTQPATANTEKEVYQRRAVIKTECQFPAAFEVDVSLAAEPSRGHMQILLLGDRQARPVYRLSYYATPSQNRAIKIFRSNKRQRQLVGTATAFPMLEDGALHRIQWIRDVYGNMSVVVDGEAILQVKETEYKDAFSGLALINGGGTYEWDAVKIVQPLKKSLP